MLLIIWYQRWNRVDRGVITFLSNRLGDFFLLFRAVMYSFLGGWFFRRRGVNNCLTFLLVVACLTKSAQVPLRVWLPLAIRAPTPIRALVHSRTLVTAGIFLAIKLQCLLSSELLFFLGTVTIIVAGRIRIFEIDLKKIVALSTLRQLGFLRVGVAVGVFSLALFHIIRHALTKSALFIVVGVILHKNLGSQDKRLLCWRGGGQSYSFLSLCVCILSLCGVGLTRGAVRKEIVLLRGAEREFSFLVIGLFMVGVAFTFIYCVRLATVFLQQEEGGISSRVWRRKEIARSLGLVIISCLGG